MSAPTVLVAGRHAGHALELRRCGIAVSEAADLGADPDPFDACLLDAVGSTDAPGDWPRVLELLLARPAVPVVVLVDGAPPRWLDDVADRVQLVRAPISGRALADRVLALAGSPDGADDVIDLGLPATTVVDLVGAEAPELTAVLPRQGRAPARVRPSVPLHMADVEEVVDRLRSQLLTSRPLREVASGLALDLAGRLAADVGVLATPLGGRGWVVVGGVGLRDVEWRALSDDPPVLDLLDARHPVLRVDASDDVRASLASLPCARHEHVLVARHPAVPVLVVAGRDARPFGHDDARAVVRVVADDQRLTDEVRDALALRGLASALARYLDT